MYCQKCGALLKEGSVFCHACGAPVGVTAQKQEKTSAVNLMEDITQKITKAAGIEHPGRIKFKDIFSEVFKKHTTEQAEEIFAAGTPSTTPDLHSINHEWPKPWLFGKVFVIVLLCYIGMYIGVMTFNNDKFIPGLIMFGSSMIPLSLLVFFWEVNVRRNISMYRMLIMLFVGGVAALLFTMILSAFTGNSTQLIGMVISIGIVEEAAKAAAILLFARNTKFSGILNGMLIGAAVGAGFSVFESAGYAFDALLTNNNLNDMLSSIFWRGLLSPGGHIVWAGMVGAALFMVKGNQKFETKMLGDFRFLRVLLIAIVLHAVWDYISMRNIGNIGNLPVASLILTAISWVIIFAMIAAGLKQVSQMKEDAVKERTAQIAAASNEG